MKARFGLGGVLGCLLISTALLGQFSPASSAASEVGLPYFETKVFSSFSPDTGGSLAKVFVQIVNGNLTFIKNDSGFGAEVQIEVFMEDKEQEFLFSRTLSHKVFVENYPETISHKALNTFITEVPVEPGKYEVLVTVLDKNNNNQFSKQTKFEVSPQNLAEKNFLISDILFFSEFETDSSGKITDFDPTLSNSFANDREFIYAYYNSFVISEDKLLKVEYKVKDDQGRVIQSNRYYTEESQTPFAEHYLRLNRYYFKDNQYVLELVANLGEQWVIKNTSFAFFWRFVPSTQQDLDLAFRQLRYIAPNDSLNRYKDSSYSEKKDFFERFWKRRDPDPSTEQNELMEEYYRRVEFANANFSASRSQGGWLSDRGRILIKFGQPDDIERHPFEAETNPYQIWRYYSLQKVFLFIDRTGFGDYDLHPSYYFVEYD